MNMKEWNDKFIMYRRTIKQLKDAVNRDLSSQGISLQHTTYLLLLANNGQLRIKELNALSSNDASLTTRALKLLKDKNLIDRTCDSVRKCQIFLTDKGKDVVQYIGEIFLRLREDLSKSNTHEGQEALLSAILS
ncbi:MAG: MarR family transcriptional regulator [Bacilli bacterium]|jgi:DNA-binding MarR family transcriptional regulator|nr:MarR family transcriptional regulator [Bacilli bacterium]